MSEEKKVNQNIHISVLAGLQKLKKDFKKTTDSCPEDGKHKNGAHGIISKTLEAKWAESVIRGGNETVEAIEMLSS